MQAINDKFPCMINREVSGEEYGNIAMGVSYCSCLDLFLSYVRQSV